MTTLFTVLALAVAAYRFRRHLFTRAEWILFALWIGHFLFELAVMLGELRIWRFEARFFRPADFLTWFYLAWGVVDLCRRFRRARHFLAAAFALIVAYDGVMLMRAKIPLGRRNAYAAACDWAAEKIKADWKGPARDPERLFALFEYRMDCRPVVDCFSARVPYLVGGRSDGVEGELGDRAVQLDRPDYWIQDLRQDDPPKGDDWELMGTFKRGNYTLPLYRRK